MGWIKKAVMGRWLAKWLLRGGPWSIAAKLGLVAVYGAWKWRKEARELRQESADREIPADYEVIEDRAEAPVHGTGGERVPPPAEQGRGPSGTTPDQETDSRSTR